MALETAFVSALAAALACLGLSLGVERLMTPRPTLMRPTGAWALHVGMCLAAHALLTLLLGRPWFAAAAVLAFLLMLVLVNNAKFRALREPFVMPDFEYFVDTIRHPRLYITFLGWGKFLASAAGFTVAGALGLWGESAPGNRWSFNGQLGAILALLAVAGALLLGGSLARLKVSFDAERDLLALGLLASLWRYAAASRRLPNAVSAFSSIKKGESADSLPHLVAVQSESFFDIRPLFAGIGQEVLAEFDRLKADATLHGKLKVPAWGANTVRSEFAFLSGLDEAKLDAHRFNPYRAVAKGWEVPTLVGFLKRLGYRTIAIHPYPASFYQRAIVYERLGFDEFLDIRAFVGAERFGPYVSDGAVTEKIAEVLAGVEGPVFVFAITMENHGPLHLEKASHADWSALFTQPPPADCEDLAIYLRHLRNADRMIKALRKTLQACARPAALCWFGDHVPIMPRVYETFGTPDGDVDYVLWSNRQSGRAARIDLFAHDLALEWLKMARIV